MKAAVITRYGQIGDVVRLVDVQVPVCGPRDVLIKIYAAGVNPVDCLMAKGFMAAGELEQPRIIGSEVAGVVAAVGNEVTFFAAGDEVYARVDPAVGGAFAEYTAVHEDLVAAKPEKLTFEEAAGLPLVALTAWQALTEQADVRAGSRVLIHGGAGGVGSTAIQIAKYLGAEVVTTASTDSVDLVRELGADRVIDYQVERFDDVISGIDVVLDTIGGDTQERSFRVLKEGGTLVSIVPIPDVEARQARWGVAAHSFFMRPNGEQLTRLTTLVNARQLRPIIEVVFPLDETIEALLKVERGGARGKTVIRVRP